MIETRAQLTVGLENRPGILAEIADTLDRAGIAIEAFCALDTIEQGVLRLICSDANEAAHVLKQAGYFVVETEVLALSTEAPAACLADLARRFVPARLNIEYAYAAQTGPGEPLRLYFKVNRPDEAAALLREASRPW